MLNTVFSIILRKDRQVANAHISDVDLLLAADGELPARRFDDIHAHLSACWDCRARMAEVEATIADFVRAHRHALDHQLPPIDRARALLRVQLAELRSHPSVHSSRWLFRANWPVKTALLVTTVLLVAATLGVLFFPHFVTNSPWRRTDSSSLSLERGAEPNPFLTPGATRIAAISDVCSMPREQVVSDVPASLRQEVLHEYGIVNFRPDEYEIDFLIAPGLGGIEDIHNLWPQPAASRTWNAHVKDALEERLHEMVCAGKLDLSTAQRDIATDWIAAYKKYFHTDSPFSVRSHLSPHEAEPAQVDQLTTGLPERNRSSNRSRQQVDTVS